MKSQDKTQKIFVGMSGGVDSSTTAAMLKKQGYNVSGVFIRGWYPTGIPCTWREDRRDAMRVCAMLDIPFYTFDFSKEYKKHIIDYMIAEYKEGRTPNPDIMCNKHIKFDLFLKKAREIGADKIATGHYVKIVSVGGPTSNRLELAEDKSKDQSYFLWTLGQEQLKHCLFPLGDYQKTEVRDMAKKFGLPVAEKKDSQGLCFVGEFNMEEFLKNYIKPKPGKIFDDKGNQIGEHRGVQYYTIGQRHGFGLSGKEAPMYIVEKNIKKNILVVSPMSDIGEYLKKKAEIKDINWTLGETPDLLKNYLARIRYRQPLQKCRIHRHPMSMQIKVVFEEGQVGVASGQSLVIYEGDTMLGGGTIK